MNIFPAPVHQICRNGLLRAIRTPNMRPILVSLCSQSIHARPTSAHTKHQRPTAQPRARARQSPALCPDGAVAGKLRHQGRQATRGGTAVGRAAARRRRRNLNYQCILKLDSYVHNRLHYITYEKKLKLLIDIWRDVSYSPCHSN